MQTRRRRRAQSAVRASTGNVQSSGTRLSGRRGCPVCVCVRVRVRVVCVVDGDAVEVQQAGLQARFRGGLADPAIVPERVAAAKARVWLMP